MGAAVNEAIPFPRHPSFKRRGEYVAWLLQMYPDCPEWVYVAAAGDDAALYLQEVRRLRG